MRRLQVAWQRTVRAATATLGPLLIALAVATTVATAAYVVRQDEINTCHTHYIDALREANAELGAVAAEERQAQRDFLLALATPGRTPTAREAAYRTYLAALDRADQRRNQHPLPTESC